MPKRRGRGEGGVEQLPSGKWRASRGSGDGRQRSTFDTKPDALKWLHTEIEDAGEWSDRTLSDWLDFWLASKEETVEPATLHWYRSRANRRVRPALGGLKLSDLTPVRVQGWMGSMMASGASPHERYTCLKTLRAALQDAVRMGELGRNVATSVKLPKLKKSVMRCLDHAEAIRFLEAARTDRYAALYDLALDGGLRPGELIALHWPNLDLVGGVVTVERTVENINGKTRLKAPKTDRARRISICGRTAASLRQHRITMGTEGTDTAAGPVFVGRGGSIVDPKALNADSFRSILRRAGLPPIRMYDLRHTSATLLLSKDVNVKVVSERLGHSDIATTLRHYAHALPCMQERAISALQSLFGDLPTESPRTGS